MIGDTQKIRRLLIFVSFLTLPVTLFYFSPVIILQGAFQGILTGSFIVFFSLFLLSFIFGRAFCGWLCPASAPQEYCALINGRKLKKWRSNIIKKILWCVWVVAIPFGLLLYDGLPVIGPFFSTHHGISVYKPWTFIVYYGALGLFCIPAILIGQRAFCYYVCWMAPFMVVGKKIRDFLGWPALRLLADRSRCTNCMECDKACQMSLRVNAVVQAGIMENDECILCGLCVEACPERVISFDFTGPGRRAK